MTSNKTAFLKLVSDEKTNTVENIKKRIAKRTMTAQELVDKFNAQYPVGSKIMWRYGEDSYIGTLKRSAFIHSSLLIQQGTATQQSVAVFEIEEDNEAFYHVDCVDYSYVHQPTATEMFEGLSDNDLRIIHFQLYASLSDDAAPGYKEAIQKTVNLLEKRISELQNK